MKRDIFTDKRRRERRTTELKEDVLCRRIYGERRKNGRVALVHWWLSVDYLDEDVARSEKGA